MTASTRTSDDASLPPGGSHACVRYHCVCGECADLDLRTGGRCEACGRRYSAEVARLAATETIQMPLGFEEPLEPAPGAAPAASPTPGATPAAAPVARLFDGRTAAAESEPAESEPAESGPAESGPERAATPAGLGLPSDRRLGHFRVVGRLGHGGMGEVYRALDESLQRYVAIKVLRPAVDGSPSASGSGPVQLLQEARAQARVNHPGVVHIYYVSPDPQRPFLAMELVAGSSLADRLRGGPLAFRETVEIALQITKALRHAARYDVVHGDIKPGNILLGSDGVVKLSDFGLARRISGPRTASAGSITGTPHYLPPEVVGGREPDIRSDLYSLGVMLFEMTFGRRPYTVESGKLHEHIEAHRSAPPEFPESWPADLPEGWRDVLARLLEKEPEDRYQTHDELLKGLERLKPVDLPRAGRVNRALAWLTDLFVAWAAGTLLIVPFAFLASRGLIPDSPALGALILSIASVIVLSGAIWLQAAWKTTVGKSLFQLRIVDRHGLTPNCGILAARVPVQLLPILGDDLQSVFDTLGGEGLGTLAVATVAAVTLTDAAVAFVRRDGRSLHDLAFGTRVALDTRTEASE